MSCCCVTVSSYCLYFFCSYVLINGFIFLITRFMFVFLFCMFYFLFCVFCVFVLFCVLFLSMHIAVYFLFVYNFYRLLPPGGTHFEILNIKSYHILSTAGRVRRLRLCTSVTFWTRFAVHLNPCQTSKCRMDDCLGKHRHHPAN